MSLTILIIRDWVILWEVSYDPANRLLGWLDKVNRVGHGVALTMFFEIFHLVDAVLVQLVKVDLELGEETRSEGVQNQDRVAWGKSAIFLHLRDHLVNDAILCGRTKREELGSRGEFLLVLGLGWDIYLNLIEHNSIKTLLVRVHSGKVAWRHVLGG